MTEPYRVNEHGQCSLGLPPNSVCWGVWVDRLDQLYKHPVGQGALTQLKVLMPTGY